jgi:hypothetical protein
LTHLVRTFNVVFQGFITWHCSFLGDNKAYLVHQMYLLPALSSILPILNNNNNTRLYRSSSFQLSIFFSPLKLHAMSFIQCKFCRIRSSWYIYIIEIITKSTLPAIYVCKLIQPGNTWFHLPSNISFQMPTTVLWLR